MSSARLYSIIGIIFGILFPILGTWVYSVEQQCGVIEAQKSSHLLWLIDTAPIFLGLLAGLAGKYLDSVEGLVHQRTKKLSDSQRTLSLIFDSINSGIVLVDREYIIQQANISFLNIIKEPSKRDLIKQPLATFYSLPDDITPRKGELKTTVKIKGAEYALSRTAHKDSNGNSIGWLDTLNRIN
jgi:PAS domain-containing protein